MLSRLFFPTKHSRALGSLKLVTSFIICMSYCYCWPALRTRYALVADVGRSVCCLSCGSVIKECTWHCTAGSGHQWRPVIPYLRETNLLSASSAWKLAYVIYHFHMFMGKCGCRPAFYHSGNILVYHLCSYQKTKLSSDRCLVRLHVK